MNRFELALDGNCPVGKGIDVFVDTIKYGDKDYASTDEVEFLDKARKLLPKMNGESIGKVVDIIRASGLDFDKVLIDRGGISFDSYAQTFSKNVMLVSFNFGFDNEFIVAYHD